MTSESRIELVSKQTLREILDPLGTVEVRDHVAHLTLNRPEAANALNLELASDLRHAARRCANDASIRAVLISGAGKLFCAGGDLKSFAAAPEGELADLLEQVTLNLHQAISHLARMNAPVVAAVHGSAAASRDESRVRV